MVSLEFRSASLRRLAVRLGGALRFSAVYADEGPPASPTLVALHGAPGSHNDFKYLRVSLSSASLRRLAVRLGGALRFSAVYADEGPPASPTLVALHGAPGSHNDFKYLRVSLSSASLRRLAVRLGGALRFSAVYADEGPPASPTLVALHGAPGSHNDFKYLRVSLSSASLRRLAVRLGGALRFSAVYADEGPPASPTLVALHGAPGSHNDFKYLRVSLSSASLRRLAVRLGGALRFSAVYADEGPPASPTLVALHGAPGSHNDFKYLRVSLSSASLRRLAVRLGGALRFSAVYADEDPPDSPTLIALHGAPGSHNDFKYLRVSLSSASLRRLAVRLGGALRFSAVYADEGPPASPTLVALHGAPGSHNDFKYLRVSLSSASLRRLAVRLGGALRFSAVYADEGPPASPTLVALHGAPGSHNDFKYLRAPCSSSSLRLLCPDLPGFGFTAMDGQESFRHTTGEKVAFLGAWMDGALEGGAADVLLAHSAGTFPALRLIAQEPERASVLVLVNPGGVRPHKVMRPTLGPALFAWLYDRVWLRPLLRPLIAFVLRKVAGLRVADGDVGGVCAQTISRVGFAEQRRAAARLAASDAHVLLLFGGQDPVVETEVSLELCSLLGCGRPLVHASEAETRAALRERLGRGLRRSAVIFPHDGHYANKTQAALVLTLARDVLGHVPSSH